MIWDTLVSGFLWAVGIIAGIMAAPFVMAIAILLIFAVIFLVAIAVAAVLTIYEKVFK